MRAFRFDDLFDTGNLRAAFCIVLSHGSGVFDHLGAAMSDFAIHDVPVLWVATLIIFAGLYETRTNGLGKGGGDMESSGSPIALPG